MGNFFDDFDIQDFAFWGGFIETQLEGEKEEKQPDEPLSFEKMLKTGNEKAIETAFSIWKCHCIDIPTLSVLHDIYQ